MRTRPRTTAAAALLALATSVLTAAPVAATEHPTITFVADPDLAEDPGTPDVAAGEGDSGTSQITFHLHRTGETSSTLDVNVFTSDGSAVSSTSCGTGVDYVAKNGQATFDGSDITEFVVTICGDGTPEANETFTVNLAAPDAEGDPYDIGDPSAAVGTIMNDDGPTLAFSLGEEGSEEPFGGKEGATGTSKAVTITVEATWSGSASERVAASVGYRTLALDEESEDEPATPGEDYVVIESGRLDVPPPASGNTSSHTFTVTVLGDDIYEGSTDEKFQIELVDARFAVIGDLEGDGIQPVSIEDDEDPPVVTVDDASVIEGDTETSPADVVVHLSHPSAFETVVNYTTGDGTATNVPGSDYVPIPSGTQLIIPPLATSGTIEAHAKGDTTDEANETFKVNLSKPTDEQFSFPEDATSITSTVTILNDDGPVVGFARTAEQDGDTPRLEWGDVAQPEGSGGQTVPFVFTVELSETVGEDVTVGYTTIDGTATASSGGVTRDYEKATGSAVIAAGSTTAEVTVNVNGDDFAGPTEWFFLDLTTVSPSGVSILDDRARGTLVSDDGPPIAADDVDVVEGDPDGDATTEVELTLSIDTPYEVPAEDDPGTVDCGHDITCDVTVRYATVDGTATTDDGDYDAAEGTLTIPEGETSATLTLTVTRDDIAEADETFVLRLSEPSFAVLGPDAPATRDVVVTIGNDDGPTVTIGDVTVAEGDDGTVDAAFPIALSEAAPGQVEIDFATSDGTATATDGDYIARTGSVKILPGGKSATVVVKVVGDLRHEADETFDLVLSDAQFAVLAADSKGTATITNDDENRAPVADAGPDLTGTAGQALSLDGSASSDPDGHALTYAWKLGDGMTATGATPSHTYPEAGTYTVTLTVTDPLGAKDSDELVVEVAAAPAGDGGGGGSGDTVTRSSGTGRIETAVDVSADHWDSASDVVLATARNFPDALAGGALAADLGAPLLLTRQDALPDVVTAELTRLGAQRVWILGGTSAISQAVEDALGDAGYEVRRVKGGDRFGTAAAVAELVGVSPAGEVALALGAHEVDSRAWPDALSAGSLAASADRLPTLLTRVGALPATTEQALADLGAKRVLLVGGTAAISQAVEERLRDLGYVVERLRGIDRYSTSVEVAEAALDRATSTSVPVVFATGRNYPDGLAAAALAARLGGIVVLVNGNDATLTAIVDAFLRHNAEQLGTGVVVGGTGVVTETIRAQIVDAMGG